MNARRPAVGMILGSTVSGLLGFLGLYWVIDRMSTVNGVGLLHRQGFPWSSLPVWMAVGALAGLARGVSIDRRARRHEASFDAMGAGPTPIPGPGAGPELIAADGPGPWETDPTVREMPLLREATGSSSRTQAHRFSHRMAGTHRGRPIEVFDLTTEVRSTSGDGPSSRTLSRTVVLLPGTGLPAFELRPRTIGRRILGRMGLGGLEFDSRQVGTLDEAQAVAAFAGRYDVSLEDILLGAGPARRGMRTGPDRGDETAAEDEVRRLFTPAAMRTLSGCPGWSLESSGGHLALWRDGGWFFPADERPARAAEALAIVEALEAAWRGDDGSRPVPAGVGPSPRERLIRRQATSGVGCAGVFAGAFLGFAVFGALMSASQPPPGGMIKPGPPVLFAFFPLFPLGGALIGGLIGAALGRLAVFPAVRDCPPLARSGSPVAMQRGRSWRSKAGMVAGFFLGAVLGLLTAFLMTALNRPIRGPQGALFPLALFGGAGLGLLAGMTIGLILDFRHAARAQARAATEPAESLPER